MKRTLRLTQLDVKGNEKLLKDEFTTDSEVMDFIVKNPGAYEIRQFVSNEVAPQEPAV